MYKKLICSLIVAGTLLVACDPDEDRDSLSGAITADDLNISATAQVVDGKNSNSIDLNSDGVGCLTSWDYGNGVTTRTNTTVQVVLKGANDIVFNGLNHDGTYITKTLTVQVDTLIDVPEEWGILCGTGEKKWVWNDDGSYIWGNGGYRGSTGPDWWGRTAADITEETAYAGWDADSYMVFSVKGSSLTKSNSTGTKVETGSFSFDMSEKIMYNGDADVWSEGKLYTQNVTVLQGISQNDGKIPVYEYDIIHLDESNMVLAYKTRTGWSEDNWGEWAAEAWFWKFKAADQ